ncbi:SusC/RagA family TonB-linked outer membrane protein [Flavobacterium sp. GT3R68]|uniref:SusC/RagA family TonB-linked outer membrane protein n=1 Tax=Flavobacterium sp. GT3R68 TaxID=2594437 RepID=UPI000F882E18|nr:SusC/RagA family TonB-linked outer membrane protein [Flavobacterium sp. GT3R68]RTY90254.1 SusC/RagA family TonB-linked outer membrane protein [Flavobacterium sp. GSN2]TRW90555.1 SusC/RagA family TonB-linked outer membrane protein [Flavobacterium sp. GT3R68]
MRSKFKWIFTLLLALSMQFSFAQEKTVTGVVSDATGPLPGANVVVKGTTRGVQTDVDGKYSIKANAGDVLVFSFVGMTETTAKVGASNTVNVKMQDGVSLTEVVVTSFGIKRKTKELAYATKNVEAKELVQAAPINAVSALAGKVSGLNIITRNNGVNPSTAIILRGYKNMTGSNAALIVIDGVVQPATALDNLNPNDIVSANVLKGASSTALYGSEGANGAIIVTTKQGKIGTGLEVGMNTSYTVERIKYFPELQTTFGSGVDNLYDPYENTSWGPRFDGLPRRLGPILADGSYQTVNYSAIKNNKRDFFVDGITTINGLSMSGGDEKSTFFFSAQRADISGITPKDKYTKDNFRLNASRKGEKMKISTVVSFFQDKSNIAGGGGYQDRPLFWSILNTPAQVPLTSYKDWQNNPFAQPEGYYNEYYQNPYMLIDIARDTKRVSRLNTNVKFEYDFNSWISATYSLAGTFLNQYAKDTRAAITYNPALAPTRVDANTSASVDETMVMNKRFNSDLIFKFDRKLTDSFKATLLLGNAVQTERQNVITIGGDNLFVPNLYNPSVRTGELSGGTSVVERKQVGYFADLTLGINDFLFLNGAYRWDISSALPLTNNGFEFFTYGASLSMTDAIDSMKGDVLNFWKFNGSYASTGGTPDPGYINELYPTPGGFPFGDTVGLAVPTTAASLNFRPSSNKSWEVGTELGMFNSRLNIGVNYFHMISSDNFLTGGASAASGINFLKQNAGEMENKGFEVDVNGSVVKSKDFEWKLGVNFSKIENEVLSLGGEDRLQVGLATTEVGIFAAVGSAYPSLFGTAYTRDDEGRVVIDANTGNPILSSELKNLGSTTPDLVMGFNSSIRFKQLTLTAVADYKTGHVYYNDMVDALEFTGSTLHSATSGRQPFVFPNSSYETAPGSGIYTENTNITTSDGGYNFWSATYNGIKENYVVDATTFKLREVALNYEFPSDYLKNTFIKSVSFGLVARNIWMLRSAQNKYTDPEFTNEGQQVTGFGTQGQLPPTASYGFKMDVKF